MKNNKVIALLVCAILVMSLAMTACTPESNPSTSKQPEPQGSSTTSYVPKDVTVALYVKNQRGAAVKAKMTIRSLSAEEAFTVDTDEEGFGSIILLEGEYMVYFEEVPENHLGNDVKLTVQAGMQPVVLEVIDNTPNGTMERPYALQDAAVTYHFASNETYYFTIRAGIGRSIVINSANAEVVFQDTTYTPDADGKITFLLYADDPRTVLYFTVTNKSSEEQDIEILPMTDPGTMDNPYELTALGEAVTAVVVGEDIVYYRWVATQSGTLVVSSDNTNNNITMHNHTSYVSTGFSSGAASVSLKVTEGDVVRIEVSTLNSVNPEGDEIVFTLTVE